MENAIRATRATFESSCERTPEYLAWHRLFKREFTNFLKGKGCGEIEISKPNHFDMFGFFRAKSGQIFYFSISDLRWCKSDMLIRTAEHYKDYTGGSNQSACLTSLADFEHDFDRIVR